MFAHIFGINCDALAVQIARIIGNIFHQTFQNGMQTTCTDVFGGFVNLPGRFGNAFNTGFSEVDVHTFSRHQRFVLDGDGGIRFGKDTLKIAGGQRLQLDTNRQTTLQFWDQVGRFGYLECTRSDKQNVICFHHAVLGGDGAAFNQRQQVALYAFAGHVRAGAVAAALTDFVDLIDKYNTWSSYQPEDEGILVACASIHGNTKKAAELLAEKLKATGVKVAFTDLCRDDLAEAVEDAFRYDRLVLCACTYDGGIFPPMEDFLHHLKAKAYQNRKIAFVENGSWAPTAARQMKAIVEGFKNIECVEPVVTIKSTLNEASERQMDELVAALTR